jgi:L-lysine 2,3-aminomutase
VSAAETATLNAPVKITDADVQHMLDRYGYTSEIRDIIANEKLLPVGLLNRVHATWPRHSGLMENARFLFRENKRYRGVEGFREVVKILEAADIHIGHLKERELFINIYRFLATSHVLNAIDWDHFEKNSLFQLVFPQPGMLRPSLVDAWMATTTDEERQKIVDDYMEETNPHDGNQQLNKPWYTNAEGDTEFLQGSQHKYPQCALIFDKSTQDCMAFCTYCFRHAQVRGDEDMFLQRDIDQVHDYMRLHPEITDLLITGGDAGYLTYERLKAYAMPLIEDPSLLHVRTIRLGTRALTYSPEMVLTKKYEKMLELFDLLRENGIQLAWMAHFSTPRELLNPATLAAIRRLQNHGVVLRSQSPMMNHISLFENADGSIDIDRSAQNWIDLANLLNVMHIGFHSMYCARPTGEHHYFTAPLDAVNKIASKIHRSLASINRPSRYISMTSSAGKMSLLGEVEIGGEKAFALKFTEGRNMEWMDKVFLAKWDPEQNTMDLLTPWDTDEFFYRDELKEIEAQLAAAIGNG